MKLNRSIQLLYFFYWIAFFLFGRALFLSYHYKKTAELSVSEILKVFGYGLWLDFSLAAYLSVLPFLILLLSPLFSKQVTGKIIYFYTALLTILIAFLTTIDLQLYSVWGFRLDNTPLQYLNTPGEILASSAAAPVVLLFILFLAFAAFGIFLYRRICHPVLPDSKPGFIQYLAAFCWLVILILPLRGGWQEIPVNQSNVYFSTKPFPNHAAVNAAWNFGYSVSKPAYTDGNPYEYLPVAETENLIKGLYTAPSAPAPAILKAAKPNVLFIILESFTAKLVGHLGGEPGITPELDSLAKQGIAFTNFYASGDRSEKGIVALLSGYPVQTTTSIMKIPRKAEKLPHLSKILKDNGYSTSFYYGGELAFANIKSYLLAGGYNKLISKPDFPASTYNSKWGVHDHILLNRVLADLNKEKQPFFSTVFTLSSHEPFEVPMKTQFPGDDEPNLFRNSMYYTDQSVGDFIRAAKKQPWWHNTLVVLVADHGHALPNYEGNHGRTKFHIPLIITGGAVAQSRTSLTLVASQTDLAYSLLKQLNLPASEFKWSKDIFNQESKPFAFYVFNDGFGLVKDQGAFSFDNVARKVITQENQVSETDIKEGKAYMQESFGDFLKK